MRDFKKMAEQLHCPNGEEGVEAAANMYRANSNMIHETVLDLQLKPGQAILEIGFGNGQHLPYLFAQAGNLHYCGVDISELMVAEAGTFNHTLVQQGQASFIQVTGNGFPDLEAVHFNKVFTVNTLYFWEEPLQQLDEIHRVLKTGGQLSIAFIEKSFAEHLPFTQYGFTLYTTEQVQALLEKAGFTDIRFNSYQETITSNTGQEMERPFIISSSFKY